MDSLSCLKSQPSFSPSFPPLVPLFWDLFMAFFTGGIAELETSVYPLRRRFFTCTVLYFLTTYAGVILLIL